MGKTNNVSTHIMGPFSDTGKNLKNYLHKPLINSRSLAGFLEILSLPECQAMSNRVQNGSWLQ